MVTDKESLTKKLPRHAKRLGKEFLADADIKDVRQYEEGGTVWVEMGSLEALHNLPTTRRLKPRVTFYVNQTEKLEAQRQYREARRKTS